MELELELGSESESESGSGSGLDRVGDEIWVEIISNLPCKIATQCKCVCKRWLALISDYHYFTSRFVQHHKKSESSSSSSLTTLFPSLNLSKFINLFSNNNITSLDIHRFRHLNFIPKLNSSGREFIHVLAKYKDLVLLCHDKSHKCFHDVYYVCNPRTKQWVSLPPYPYIPTLPFRYKVCVGFISEDDLDLDNDVKFTVVRFDLFKSDSNLYSYNKVNNFSSQIGEWRELINSNLNHLPNPYPKPRLYTNLNINLNLHQAYFRRIPGLTHSVACNGTIFFRDHMRRLIGFNVLHYYFRYIDLPPFPFVHRLGVMDMGVCRGHLRICQWIYMPRYVRIHPHICIWELHPDFTNIRWSLVHKLYPKDLIPNNFIPSYLLNELRFKGLLFKAIDFHPNNGDVVHIHMIRQSILSCNLLNKTVGLLLTFKIDEDDSVSPVNVNVINQPYSQRPGPELEYRRIMPLDGVGRAYDKVYWTAATYFLDHLLWPTPLPKVLRRKLPSSSSPSSTNSSEYMVAYTDFDKIPQLNTTTK